MKKKKIADYLVSKMNCDRSEAKKYSDQIYRILTGGKRGVNNITF